MSEKYNNIIQNIELERFNIDLDLFNEKRLLSKENLDYIKNIKPNMVPYSIRFIVNDTSRIANTIRRYLLDELPVKCLTFEYDNFQTTDDYLLDDYVQKRLSLTPINQNIDEKAIFSLHVINEDTPKKQESSFESEYIKATDLVNKKTNKQIKQEEIPLVMNTNLCGLFPGKSLGIEKIYVQTGYGHQHAKFSLVSNIEFSCTQYINVGFLQIKGNIRNFMVNKKELSQNGIKPNEIEQIRRKEEFCLVITSNDYFKNLEQEQKDYIKKHFKYIINKNIKYEQSTECIPEGYELVVHNCGNIEPKQLMNLCFIELLKKLNFIKEKDPNYIKIHKKIYDNNESEFKFKFKQDTTLAEAFHIEINNLDKNCSVLNVSEKHPLDRAKTLIMEHSDAENVFFKACDILIKKFEAMAKEFQKEL